VYVWWHCRRERASSKVADAPFKDRLEMFGDDFDAEAAFLDTAAVMMHLDLVVTSDTSIAHLAGALGREVFVALRKIPDWRFLLGRDDSPWYPSMRLFRQTEAGNWRGRVRAYRAGRTGADRRSALADLAGINRGCPRRMRSRTRQCGR
jgi:hypothetical protein